MPPVFFYLTLRKLLNCVLQMKLKQVHIDSYKLFRGFDIDFCVDNRPLSIVVLAGINGNGKSTLLKYLLPKRISTNHTGTVNVLTDNGDESFQIPPSIGEYNRYKQVFDTILYFDAENVSQASGQLQREVLRYVDRVVYVEGKTSFEAYQEIQSLIDDVFADFHLQVRFKGIDENKQLVFVNGNGEAFGVDGLSDGEKQVLAKVFPLFAADMKGRVILMDEPESSLHPSWQGYLLPVLRRCAEANDCQFILATHSPQIISSAYKEEIRMLTRNAEGHVQAEYCVDGPYGWTVEKVLDEIQGVPMQRVPEIERRLEALRMAVRGNRYDTEPFKHELAELEALLGYSDRDLTLIRLEIIRRKKGQKS